MLKVWGRKTSLNVQKVMWLLNELGLPHERVDAGGRYGVVDTPEYGRLNPNRRVPTIEDGGAVIWESHSISRYIAAKYAPGSAFWPEDPAARAYSEKWMDWSLGTMAPPFTQMFTGYYRTKAAERKWPQINSAIERTAFLMKILDAHMADRKNIAGDTLTLGDIVTAPFFYRYFTVGLERPSLPNLEAWYARLQERPAYRTHVMVPYDELFEDGAR